VHTTAWYRKPRPALYDAIAYALCHAA
jgi:hypothetical protein